MTEKQIDEMVSHFLGWKLPQDFAPDAGITFKPTHQYDSPHWPIGTNLMNAEQARVMIKHMLESSNVELSGRVNDL